MKEKKPKSSTEDRKDMLRTLLRRVLATISVLAAYTMIFGITSTWHLVKTCLIFIVITITGCYAISFMLSIYKNGIQATLKKSNFGAYIKSIVMAALFDLFE